ncbi:S41 family peptidase [Paenibacillus sanguinis]|uniref:S41 family peptidase n=1 Tax=Paenibacillus sanguinis TaxID=225906 RepID=UPI0003624863|nr:S41 family peptidase [Paenibacillus sanguinis]
MIPHCIRKYALIPLLSFMLLGLPQAVWAAEADATTEVSDLKALQEVLYYLDTYNIEGVQRQELLDNAIRGMVYTLDDPYSDYFTEEELQSFEDGVNQEFVGIGVTLRYAEDKLVVTDVLKNSPAAEAGVLPGDIIIDVDGLPVTSSEDILRIQGAEHTEVKITVDRAGQPLVYSITRAHFSLPSVTGKIVPYSKVGYIAISSFSDTADEEFAEELARQRKEGIGALVLDLRDNLGGYVESATNIAKLFMDDQVLMYTATQSGELQPVVIEDGQPIGMPVVILTNELTASASEILTGALRDNDIATVVGEQTYGKARIQNIFTLSNGSSLKLTVQAYFTPNREDFNYVGLKPDIEIEHNAVAQLVTGLYEAGVRRIDLSGSPASLSINGAAFPGYVDVLKDGDKVYAPSRLLAALVKGQPAWTTSNQKLTITDQVGKQAGFAAATQAVKLVESESYLELHEFVKKYPHIRWSYDQGVLNLSNR